MWVWVGCGLSSDARQTFGGVVGQSMPVDGALFGQEHLLRILFFRRGRCSRCAGGENGAQNAQALNNFSCRKSLIRIPASCSSPPFLLYLKSCQPLQRRRGMNVSEKLAVWCLGNTWMKDSPLDEDGGRIGALATSMKRPL